MIIVTDEDNNGRNSFGLEMFLAQGTFALKVVTESDDGEDTMAL